MIKIRVYNVPDIQCIQEAKIRLLPIVMEKCFKQCINNRPKYHDTMRMMGLGGLKKMYNIRRTHNGRYQITGLRKHTLILDNKHDAWKHAEYLNNKQEELDRYIKYHIDSTNKEYKIHELTRRIKQTTNNPHVLELTMTLQDILENKGGYNGGYI